MCIATMDRLARHKLFTLCCPTTCQDIVIIRNDDRGAFFGMNLDCLNRMKELQREVFCRFCSLQHGDEPFHDMTRALLAP